MRFSIFTPTHNPKHLPLVYDSLKAQTYQDFEWVIGINNMSNSIEFPPLSTPGKEKFTIRIEKIPTDDKINGTYVGYLKNFMCTELCKGDYLVELDHDDELTPNALQELSDTIDYYVKKHELPPDFIYSDAVHIHDSNHTTQTYSGMFGWRTPYELTWGGRKYLNNAAFPISAASLHDIFYSPDHVRVWRREFYNKIGGHDVTLSIGDDHDLIQRTYIAGGSMVYIPECLYIYHLHEDASNTYLQRNAAIQEQQGINGDKHRNALIREWCKREKLLRVELGGGCTLATAGVIGVALDNADLCFDITEHGLPFMDNSVGHIHAQDFLEHIPHCKNGKCPHTAGTCTVGMMNEIWRVLAPNGWFTSITPSTGGRGAFQDPTHCSFWNQNSFMYYTQATQANYLRGCKARFIQRRLFENYPSDWYKDNQILYVNAVLNALKEPHQPGVNGFWLYDQTVKH